MAKKKPAPKKQAPRRKPAKKRDYKAEYARRIKNAEAKGKTRQQARGHKKNEHILRREREKAETGGLSRDQIKIILNWHRAAFNPKQYREVPTEDELIEWTLKKGYPRFKQYRKIWDAARRQYKKEIADGTWESRGLKYLHHLTGMAKAPDEQWLYYH